MIFNSLFISADLPRPLSKEEMRVCFEKYKEGDMVARNTIIVHNIRLVMHEAGKFQNTSYELEEIVSIGIIGLIKSIDKFDIEKNFEFATYAARCIDNEILMFMRKNKKHFNCESIYMTLGETLDVKERRLIDTLEDFKSNFGLDYEIKDTYREVRKIVEKLPDNDRKIIMLYFGFIDNRPYTQNEIAKKLNISQSYISKLIVRTLKKIKDEIEKNKLVEMSSSYNENTNNKKKDLKKLKSIYEVLNKPKEQVDNMLLELNEEEKALITLRYGSDLENPVSSENFKKEQSKKFYGNLLPKMKRILANYDKGIKTRRRGTNKTFQTQTFLNEVDSKIMTLKK